MAVQQIKNLFASPRVIHDGDARKASILHGITLWGIPVLLIFIIVRTLSGEGLISATHFYTGFMILAFILSRFTLQRG